MGQALSNIIKFILTILLLPLVVATVMGLKEHFGQYPSDYHFFFMWGMLGFLLTFLFVYQFWGLYEFGQKVTNGMFRFAAPLDRFCGYAIPFYVTSVLILFIVTAKFLGIDEFNAHFMFFLGFSLAMHILLSAQELQQQEERVFKIGYLFTMNIVFIVNVLILIVGLDIVFEQFWFAKFVNVVANRALDYYSMLGRKILFFIN